MKNYFIKLSVYIIKFLFNNDKKSLFLFLITFTYFTNTAQNINPSSIVSVEFKTGAADQGIAFYPDMLFGASGSDVVAKLKAMNVNTLRIPVSLPMDPERVAILVNFISEIYNNGGQNMSILLSQRKWNLHVETQQESWSDDISNAFNGIASAGFGNMVKGCIFDENTALNGNQSSKALWNLRHQGVLDAMTKLNNKTNNAFINRTVFIHGKGYGSQFLGVKASSEQLDFPTKMLSRCSNYAYNFKFFQIGDPSDKSLEGWKTHYKDYCKLSEVFELGVPVMFVGDAGDGLRPNSFAEGKNPYGGTGEFVVKALRDVFVEYNWTGFSIGPFIRENATTQQTVLYSVVDGELIARQEQINTWNTWYDTTKSTPCEVGITTNVSVNGGTWSTETSQNLDAGGTLSFGPQSDAGSWSWIGPNGFTTTTREVSITNITPKQAGAYIVTHQSNSTGCISTETFNITVNSIPCSVAITTNSKINGGAWSTETSLDVEEGDTLDFGPQSDAGSWNWVGPNGFTATTREVSISNITPSQAGAYTVTHQSNATGCVSTETFNIEVIYCEIIPYIRVNKGTWSTETSQALDEGGTVDFGPQSDAGPWSWTGPNGFTATTREVSITNITPNQAGEYTATHESNTSGCISIETFNITVNTSSCEVGIKTNVRVNGGAWSTETSQNLDEGGTVDFGPQSDAGPWSWTGPNGFTATTREVSITNITPNQAGEYTVTHESNTSGCISIETFNITVNDLPTSFAPDPNKIYYIDAIHHNLRLAATGNNETAYTLSTSTTGVDVEWKFVHKENDYWFIERAAGGTMSRLLFNNTIDAYMGPNTSNGIWTYFEFSEGNLLDTHFLTLPNGDTGKRLQINATGSVNIVEDTNHSPSESFKITEVNTLKTNDYNTSPSIIIYPNPINDYIIIEGAQNSTLNIYDVNGRKVYSNQLFDESEKLVLNNLSKGIYYAEIINIKTIKHIIKLIKQ